MRLEPTEILNSDPHQLRCLDALVPWRGTGPETPPGARYGTCVVMGTPFLTTKVPTTLTGVVPLLWPSWILPGST